MTAPVIHTGVNDVTTATAGASGTITVNKPSATATGDVLVAILNHSVTGGTWDTVPAGWTQQANPNSTRTTAVFTKPIPSASAETATDYTWHTTGGSGRIGALIFRATGVSGTSPIDAIGALVGSGTSSIVDPAVTAVSSEASLIAVFSSYLNTGTANAITKPASMTNVGGWSVTSGGPPATASTTHLVAFETLSASGSTGTRTATVSPSGTGAAGFMFTLNPGSVALPPTAPVIHTTSNDVRTATVTSSAILRVDRPPATANGDTLIAVLTHRNSGAPGYTTAPPGWTPVPVEYTSNGVLSAWWRRISDASTEPSTYTWRSPNGSSRGAVTVFRVTGAAPPSATGGPIDSYGAATGSGTVSIVAPAATVIAPASLLIGLFMATAANTTAPVISAPSGMTEAVASPVVTGSASSYLEMASQALSSAGSSGAKTASVAPAAGSVSGFLLAIAPPGYGIPQPPQVLTRLTGGVTASGAKVAAVTKFATTVRIARSASPSMTSPTYVTAAPDRDGISVATFTGLSANNTYYWAVEVDGSLDAGVATFRTLPVAGTATSFSFAAASCSDTNSNNTIFDDIRTRTGPTGEHARVFAHLGDMHYQNIGVDDDAWTLGAWINATTQPRQRDLWSTVPLSYTWSDHDFGGSNVSSDSGAGPAAQRVYRRLFPSHTLPGDGKGIYQSWQIGRVLFVFTDGRSYMSPIGGVDNSSKTKLGSVQKAWFKSQLLTPGVGLVIWLHEDAWNGRTTFPNDDTWTAYDTERQELAAFIQSNGVPLLFVHGDVHALSADDGSHSPGKFPLVSCSPLDQTTFIGNGLFTSGFVPDPVSATEYSQQYGWFDLIDDGAQIVVRWYGIKSGSVAMQAEMSWGRRRSVGWGVPL